VCQDDVLDLEAVLAGEGEVLIDVALGVDDDRRARRFVADQIRGVGKAA